MSKVVLAVDRDEQCLSLIRSIADKFSLDLIEVADGKAVESIVGLRTPDVALLAVDVVGAECAEIFAALEHAAPQLAVVLIGVDDWRVTAGIKVLASRYKLQIVASMRRPVAEIDLEREFSALFPSGTRFSSEEIDAGVHEGQFILHYQAKAFLAGGAYVIRGVEALVRWLHPRLGLLHPASFLPSVVETRRMAELTDYIITEGIRQAGVWRQQGLRLQLGLNISSDLVTDLEFPRRLARVLDEYGVSPGDVAIDILEDASAERANLVHDVFTQLRLLGVGLCLDNFGVGNSSITQLMNLPLTEVKLDGSLIRRLLDQPLPERVLSCFVDLLHALGLKICAEGIASPIALQHIRAAGFDAAQGNAIASALPAVEIPRIVQGIEITRAAC